MRNMKKIGLLLVCMVLLCSLFAGCNATGVENAPVSEAEVTDTPETEPTPEPDEPDGNTGNFFITLSNGDENPLFELYPRNSEGGDWLPNIMEADLGVGESVQMEMDGSIDLFDFEVVFRIDEEFGTQETSYFFGIPLEEGALLELALDTSYFTDADGNMFKVPESDSPVAVTADDEEDEPEEEQTGAEDTGTQDWVELTFYNSTELPLVEIFVYEMGSDDAGYNHIESFGILEQHIGFKLGVDWYPSYHIELYDDTQGVMVFENVVLSEARDAEVRWDDDSEPMLYVKYNDDTIGEFEGFYG